MNRAVNLDLWPSQLRALATACAETRARIEQERPSRVDRERLWRELRDTGHWFEDILEKVDV